MRTGRPKAELILSPEEEEKLELMANRPKTDQRSALRARIVLGCAQGLTNQEVAENCEVTGATVSKWRQRFVALRIEGLTDAPRPGQPRKITDADVERVVTKTLESKPKNATHWSTRSMAKASGLNQTSIGRIWRTFGLKPHLKENFKLSTDPLFVEKVRDVVGVYSIPQRKRAPSFSALMKRAKFKPWIEPNPFCPWAPVAPNHTPTTTTAMGRSRSLPPWTSLPVESSPLSIKGIATKSF